MSWSITRNTPGRASEQTATFGITWYAQDNLDRIVFIELPAIGDQLIKDEPYAEVESQDYRELIGGSSK